jgi:hypothetical protein
MHTTQEPRAPLSLIPNFGHSMMDDVGDYAVTNAALDRLTDDQIEQLTDEADLAASAERLTDVQHDMRVEWQYAIDHMHALTAPKLPTVEAGKLVLVPVVTLVGQLMETQWATQLLCDALRTGDLSRLHVHLRQVWLDANAQGLADCGWQA